MRRKVTSIIMVVCMVLAMLPTSTFSVHAGTGSATVGDFTVTGGVKDTDYTYLDNVLTIISGTAISIANVSSGADSLDRIVVASGKTANITLSGINIDVSATPKACAFDMTGARVNLNLVGTNKLKSGEEMAGLQAPAGAILNINGSGTLEVIGGNGKGDWTGGPGAGIGGGYNKAGGEITISGGTVIATGGSSNFRGGGAGIGGGYNGAGGEITISGGTVIATGGSGASDGGAGIGGGYNGAGGEINIIGGTVTATGGDEAAGIGGGTGGTGGIIAISNGTVTATGGSGAFYCGAGIGGGHNASGGEITISGGTVSATGGSGVFGHGGAGIGGGNKASGGAITISAVTLSAIGGGGAAGIGGGNGGAGGLITIDSSANIKALSQSGDLAIQTAAGSAISTFILSATFTTTKNSSTKTEIRTSTGAVLSPNIEWEPASKYQSIALTLPSDSANYRVYTGSVKQKHTKGETASIEFGITGAGVTIFNALDVAAQTTPTFSPAGGTITWGTPVTIISAGADAIYYTTDGSIPTKTSINQATTSLVINSATTVKAIAIKAGFTDSEVASASYTQAVAATPSTGSGGGGTAATPIIHTNTGNVTGGQLNNAAGAAKNGETVTINSNKNNEVSFPASGLGSLAGKDNSLTVVTEKGTLTFDSKAVSSMGTQAKAEDIKVIVDNVEKVKLTEDQQEKVGDKEVYDLTVMSGGKLISSFNGGRVNVSIPYELKSGQTNDNISVWYMADDGSLTEINCAYNVATKSVTFLVDHFSKYIIGYDDGATWVNPFQDLMSDAWFYQAVAYVNARNLMKGQTATTFAPQAAMTRGMFVTILGRMEGVDASIYINTNKFSDVDSSQYYAPYISWASDKSIVSGVVEDKFAPNASVTREQMAVMMTNYMKYKGQGPVGEWAIQLKYGDLEDVSSWAGEGVMFVTMKSLMKGMGNDISGNQLFAPRLTSNRAQTAQLMMNLQELMK